MAATGGQRGIWDARDFDYNWSDVTNRGVRGILFDLTGDAARPGRLFGERDYYGPQRVNVDPDGDHFYGTAGQACPMYLHDQRDTGELTQAGGVDYAPNLAARMPALHAYRSLRLNDRTRVFNVSRNWGDVALGSHEAMLLDPTRVSGRIGTDTNIGRLYAEGGGRLVFADRARVNLAQWDGMTIDAAATSNVTGSATDLRLAESRLVGTFPPRTKGTYISHTPIPGGGLWVGVCNADVFCAVHQIVPPDQTVQLSPGYYGRVAVNSRSTLLLTSGD